MFIAQSDVRSIKFVYRETKALRGPPQRNFTGIYRMNDYRQEVGRHFASGLEMHQGRIPLPSGAGTGVQVDMRSLTLLREIR
jgi:hypothetical protein